VNVVVYMSNGHNTHLFDDGRQEDDVAHLCKLKHLPCACVVRTPTYASSEQPIIAPDVYIMHRVRWVIVVRAFPFRHTLALVET